MSDIPPKADTRQDEWRVRFGPKADFRTACGKGKIQRLRFNFRSRHRADVARSGFANQTSWRGAVG
jgi:hypothetical protein